MSRCFCDLLQLSEMSTVRVGGIGSEAVSLEAALSKAEDQLSNGDLSGAASTLEEAARGTAAAAAVGDWIKAARARAAAEQTLLLLQAHSTAISSSLS